MEPEISFNILNLMIFVGAVSFLFALITFISRRVRPKTILSETKYVDSGRIEIKASDDHPYRSFSATIFVAISIFLMVSLLALGAVSAVSTGFDKVLVFGILYSIFLLLVGVTFLIEKDIFS